MRSRRNVTAGHIKTKRDLASDGVSRYSKFQSGFMNQILHCRYFNLLDHSLETGISSSYLSQEVTKILARGIGEIECELVFGLR